MKNKSLNLVSKNILVRDFIQKALYDDKEGYFINENNIQLGNLEKPIPFHNLYGYTEYVNFLKLNYPKHKFLTPSEIFKPYYGMSVARSICQLLKSKNQSKLNIIEIGSGLGGTA